MDLLVIADFIFPYGQTLALKISNERFQRIERSGQKFVEAGFGSGHRMNSLTFANARDKNSPAFAHAILFAINGNRAAIAGPFTFGVFTGCPADSLRSLSRTTTDPSALLSGHSDRALIAFLAICTSRATSTGNGEDDLLNVGLRLSIDSQTLLIRASAHNSDRLGGEALISRH